MRDRIWHVRRLLNIRDDDVEPEIDARIRNLLIDGWHAWQAAAIIRRELGLSN